MGGEITQGGCPKAKAGWLEKRQFTEQLKKLMKKKFLNGSRIKERPEKTQTEN